ncbi:MAG: hypothetical protein VR74_16935 [Hyphomonas sp. BRH_c22]|uniref:hypothetical protein n=1 Tax=Hyphomonas sp. BRH_c22 TaxID=1629710 RepID=UPI0005F20DE9|nr:hypothetical protein [Hyphomonas sp. BRH_c22]KJS35271.1 MAG: hypothetical protein VR74_16935 [Hyphomonas sp. BRH_c22]
MMEPSVPEADAPLPSYAGPVQTRRFKRIKTGLLLASLAACLGVTLLGAVFTGLLSMMAGLFGASVNSGLRGSDGLLSGMYGGMQLATYNFILFFITVPAAWLALGLSIGRLPYRGIVQRRPYTRWGSIWGAILVGGTTGGFGLIGGVTSGLGALLSGGMIGAIAGAGCGLLFHAIVKPANQLSDVDVSVF